MTKPRVLAVTGCTACGKSALALKLAQALKGEIICMDSMQVYRGMDVGTAKPTPAEQAAVPHHMLDVADPAQPYAVADYVAGAEKAIFEIAQRGHLPVLVGGTGLYLKALLHGMTLGFEKSDPALRARFEAIAAQPGGKERLHAMLAEADAASAQRLHPNDLRRVIRALEVFELTGVPLSRQPQAVPERPYTILPLALRMARPELYGRIEKRAARMLRQGLLAEVEALLLSGVPAQAQAMQAIGYKELIPVAQGRLKLTAAAEQLILNTKHYAKRQETWFISEKKLRWLEAGESAYGAALALTGLFVSKAPE